MAMARLGGESYERFKWFILGSSIHEDWQGLWGPLWELRGDYGRRLDQERGQPSSEYERQEAAARALRDLHAAGLIYVFRTSSPDIAAAASDEANRLSADEVEDALTSDWWRGQDLQKRADIWWGPTAAGEQTYEELPEHLRAFG